MDPRSLQSEFLKFLDSRSLGLDQTNPGQGFAAMLEFYEVRVDGCDPDQDGDMLLYQWGTYDWGSGPQFDLDLTRQVIFPDEEGDDGIWQLNLTYRYDPKPFTDSMDRGDRWSSSFPGVSDFRRFLLDSDPFKELQSKTPRAVECNFECAG